ncbi:hypothetical protein [Lacipirellula limnantheis]|uniref:hypothetical protein n=1 Tax=Lacipirellula limnantheis TaxID=2528024 RepID=UPI001FE3ACBB|nr:hypothetical protein [Lacipirellula limnantheis]
MRALFSTMPDFNLENGLRSMRRCSTAAPKRVFAIAVHFRTVFSASRGAIERRHAFAWPSLIDRSGVRSPKKANSDLCGAPHALRVLSFRPARSRLNSLMNSPSSMLFRVSMRPSLASFPEILSPISANQRVVS